ncbi:hypothetical protein DSS3PM1_00017 [Bacteriophage DSS3_PM1]|nr:hypothetical protein DSS3PM1_00017 [Bacteriophage DSS3_PM1]
MKAVGTLASLNAQVGEIFDYYGETHWEVLEVNPEGKLGYKIKCLDTGYINPCYNADGVFSRVEKKSEKILIGYIGVDAKGDPVRPVKSGGYIGRPAMKLPPRIYTTKSKAMQYHGAVSVKPVYLE